MIATRLPSLQHNYDVFWSRDPAFVQLADDATDEQREEHARKWKIARQTGKYDDLLIPGGNPTKFVIRPIPGRVVRKMVDRLLGEDMGPLEHTALAFRVALVDVTNLGNEKVKLVDSDDYGKIADAEIADLLDRCAPGCVNEVGSYAWERATSIDPL